MKQTDKICSYNEKRSRGLLQRVDDHYGWTKEKPKRKRIVCPVCKRRMWGWALLDPDDGAVLRYMVPRHKRKKWWKK